MRIRDLTFEQWAELNRELKKLGANLFSPAAGVDSLATLVQCYPVTRDTTAEQVLRTAKMDLKWRAGK